MGRIDVGLKCIQLRSLIEKREYQEAYEVAERINLDKVTSIVDLKVIASVYERLGKYEEAKDILLRSYEKKPTKMVIYRLAYLCVKTNEFEDAEFFYQEFSNMAPNSPDRYILRYGIDRAKGVDYLLRIATLQKLKQIDYMEEWGYELAKVYHKAGLYEECIQECNDLITWFGEGIIVEKAQMLRQFHEEGKESLDPYGVFDEGLSKEEIEVRREQFIADTQDLRSQAMLLAEQQKQQEVYRQLDRDLEKTVDLRQVLAEEGEDMDLLKQAVHRSWGQPASNEYETINVKKVYAEQERDQYSYDTNQYGMQGNMHEFVPAQTPEEVIAASLAEVLTEEELGQDEWNGYTQEEQFGQDEWNGYAQEEQFGQDEWNGYTQEEQFGQDEWNRYTQEEQFGQDEWNRYTQEEQFGQDEWNGYMQEDQSGQDEWNGYMQEDQSGQDGWNGYAQEEYVQEFTQDGYVPQENEEPVYSKDDFSSMLEQVEQEYLPEEMLGEFPEGYTLEKEQDVNLEEHMPEEKLQEFSEEGVDEEQPESFSQSEIIQKELSEAVNEVLQEYREETVVAETTEEAPQEDVEEAASDKIAEEVPQENVEESVTDKTIEEAAQEIVKESALEEESKEFSKENNSKEEINVSEMESTSKQTDSKITEDMELLEEETEIPAYVHRNGNDKKRLRKEKKNKKKVSKKKQKVKQEAEEKSVKENQQTEVKAEEKPVKENQQVEPKAEEKPVKENQQAELKAEEKPIKENQQTESKAEEKPVKEKQQTESKAEEKPVKKNQQTEVKAEEKPIKENQQAEPKAKERTVKKKQQPEQKQDKKSEKKKRKGFLFNFNWRKKKEKEVISKIDVETIGKELDLLIEEVNQREEAEWEEFNTLPPEALQEREPVKKKVFTEEFSDVDPESMVGTGDSVGEPYIAKPKKEDIVKEQEVIPEAAMEVGEYTELAETVSEYVGEPYVAGTAEEVGEYVGEPYVAGTAEEAGEYVGEPYIAGTAGEAGEYVGEPYIAGTAEEAGEYVGEPYIAKRADAIEVAQTKETQLKDSNTNVPEEEQQEVEEELVQEETFVEETHQEEVSQDDFMYISGVDLWNYFAAYQNDGHLCEDIQMTMEGIKSGKRSMHMIITCKDQERASQMGRDMAKAMKVLGFVEKQQVARVTAEKLNRMHLEKNYEKLAGGFLLVEGAKKMTADTAQSIMNMINEMGNQIVVILTDARPYMNDLMNEYKMMHRYFPNDLKMK